MERLVAETVFSLWEWLVSGLITLVVSLIMFIQKRTIGKVQEIEERVRKVETEYVDEDHTRQLISDHVEPIKNGQDDIKQDIKTILKILLER